MVEPPSAARLTHHVGLGLQATTDSVRWPDGAPVGLDAVESVDATRAVKLYLDARPLTRVAAAATDGAELRFEWDRSFAPALGVWLDYGGWPAGERRHQLALEPTTSPDDDLASAMAAGRAQIVEPAQSRSWTVSLELVPPFDTAATEEEARHV